MASADDAPASSESLLQRWQSTGDREALERLLRVEIAALKQRLHAHGAIPGSPDASSSDIAQEAVLRMLHVEQPPRFENPQALRAYLWKAAWHLLVERLRRQRRAIATDSDSVEWTGSSVETTGGLGLVERRDQQLALEVTIQFLEPAEQEILSLLYTRGLSLDLAAQELRISKNAVKMRAARARTKLAHKLRGWSQLIG